MLGRLSGLPAGIGVTEAGMVGLIATLSENEIGFTTLQHIRLKSVGASFMLGAPENENLR